MGPIALFDKSFIQSLSLDESVWFSHFFITNVCPIFYVETLADLSKGGEQRRDPEDEVRIIADKFPELNSAPSAHHSELLISNLRGQKVPMIGQIQLEYGALVKVAGELSSYSPKSPTAEAFSRWQANDFSELEKRFANDWRSALTDSNLAQRHELFTHLPLDLEKVKTLEDARDAARSLLASGTKPFLLMDYALEALFVPNRFHSEIRARWAGEKYPRLPDFAPYASFVLSVELFQEIALEKKLISADRRSNRIDLAYLYYLPFCMLFISSDKLHRRTAPLFLRDDQEFVWGIDLKQSLGELDLYYSVFPDEEKEKGIYALAPTPPKHIQTLVSDLWDRHLPNWRTRKRVSPEESQEKFDEIRRRAQQIEKAEALQPPPGVVEPGDIKSTLIKRRVSRRRGKWYQIPKSLGEED